MSVYYLLFKEIAFDKTRVVYAYKEGVVTAVNVNTARIKADKNYTVNKIIPDTCSEFTAYQHSVLEATEANRLFIENLIKQGEELENNRQQERKQKKEAEKKKHLEVVDYFIQHNGELKGVVAVTDKMRMYSSVIRDYSKNLACAVQAVVVNKDSEFDKFSDVTIMTHTNKGGGYAVRVIYPEHVHLPENCHPEDLLLNAVAKVYYEIFVEGRT